MLRTLKNLNPAQVQAWAIKWLAIIGVVAILCTASYFQGASSNEDKWEAKIAAQKTAVQEQRANNTVDAGKRLGDYKYNDAQLNAAVDLAKQTVHDYYAANPPKPMTVEKTKLVPVPGQPEYVYVPTDSCPSTFFGPDELRLYNLGNEGDFADPQHPK